MHYFHGIRRSDIFTGVAPDELGVKCIRKINIDRGVLLYNHFGQGHVVSWRQHVFLWRAKNFENKSEIKYIKTISRTILLCRNVAGTVI